MRTIFYILRGKQQTYCNLFSFFKETRRYYKLIFLSVKIPDSIFNNIFWIHCIYLSAHNSFSFYFFIKVRNYSFSSVQVNCNCIAFALKENFRIPVYWKLYYFVINLRLCSLVSANIISIYKLFWINF